MKRTLSLLLTAALAFSLLAGCGPKNPPAESSGSANPGASSSQPDGSASEPGGNTSEGFTLPKVMVLSGPTGVGAAKLMADGEYAEEHREENGGFPYDPDGHLYCIDSITVVTDNAQVQSALVNKDVDIAAIATNSAANLYAQSDGAIQVLAVNTLGVLYILEKGDTVHSMADLAGKTLYAPSNTKGANPEHILNHLLEGNGVDPADVTIEWLTPQEITAKMSSSDAGICMLPVPAATALLVKDSGVREATSLSDAWQDLENSPCLWAVWWPAPSILRRIPWEWRPSWPPMRSPSTISATPPTAPTPPPWWLSTGSPPTTRWPPGPSPSAPSPSSPARRCGPCWRTTTRFSSRWSPSPSAAACPTTPSTMGWAKSLKKFLYALPAPAFWLGVWQLCAFLVDRRLNGKGNELRLPYPSPSGTP